MLHKFRVWTVHPVIRQVVNRDCHVSEPHQRVVQCIVQHQANRREYDEVMYGVTKDQWLPRTILRNNGKLTGAEIVRLMRKHHMTIAALSFRLGITQKRIRRCRETGLADPYAVRDWLEAITGEDPGPLPQPYRISSSIEEDCCSFCGYPLGAGDRGFEYAGDIFCSIFCCRKSRSW